jgi:TPR repeat protein
VRSRDEVEAYERACLLADGQGCHELGLCYQDGAGCQADPAQAYQHFAQGCDLTWAESCVEQGDMVAGDATLTIRPASDFYKLGCGHGSMEGCQRLADAVGGQSQNGDLERALDLQVVAVGLENGCNVQRAESCYTLGQLYDRGWGVSRDPVRSQDLIDLACRMGYTPACHETALRQTVGHQALTADPASGMQLLAELCQTGYVPSCASLLEHAETVEDAAASLEDLDIRSPADLARWTCDLGYRLGCDAGQVLER